MSKISFTLIELIIVISILVIIVAFAIPRFINIQSEAIQSSEAATIDAIRTAILLYKAQEGDWPLFPLDPELFSNLPDFYPEGGGPPEAWAYAQPPDEVFYYIMCPHWDGEVGGLCSEKGTRWRYYFEDDLHTAHKAGELVFDYSCGH